MAAFIKIKAGKMLGCCPSILGEVHFPVFFLSPLLCGASVMAPSAGSGSSNPKSFGPMYARSTYSISQERLLIDMQRSVGRGFSGPAI